MNRATITFPRIGVWFATLELAGTAAVSGAVTIKAASGDMTLAGTVFRPGTFAKRPWVLVMGGAAGFAKSIPGKFYKAVPLRIPLTDVLTSAGEKLSTTSNAATLATFLPRWTRSTGVASAGLRALLTPTGVSWRVLDDGSTWIGPETWPVSGLTQQALSELVGSGVQTLSSQALSLRPGVALGDRHVAEVDYMFEPTKVRIQVAYE